MIDPNDDDRYCEECGTELEDSEGDICAWCEEEAELDDGEEVDFTELDDEDGEA